MAVKNATRAEAEAKRRLKFMARDYKRFCKIMVYWSSIILMNLLNFNGFVMVFLFSLTCLVITDVNQLQKLAVADPSPSPPQDGVREEKKKVVFADEAGGCLCQVRVYEDGEPSL